MADEEDLASFRARLDGAAIFTYILVMLSVPAKIWCKTKYGKWTNLGWDDALSVVSLLWANGFFWISMMGLRPSLGRHAVIDVPLDEVEHFLMNLFAAALVYCCAIAFIKFTILAFYWRLFSVAARIPIYVIAFSVAAWLITFLSLGAFGCTPIRSQWDLSVTERTCVPPRAIYLGGSLPNVIVDFILVFMPIPYVWRLHAPVGQRLIIGGVFTLGLFICIVSIIRLTEVMSIPTDDQDVTYNLKDFILWSTVEINVGIVCSCLPSMRRILTVVGLGRLFSRGSSAESRPTPSNQTPAHSTKMNKSQVSRSMGSKAGGILSSITGLTKIDSTEDVYHMMDYTSNPQGKSQADVDAGERRSGETDNESAGTSVGRADGITIQRDWSVVVGEGKVHV